MTDNQGVPMDVDYVNMTLPNGEVVRFNRVWSGYRFTDREVDMLIAGMEIRIRTAYTDGIRGSLDWQEYNGYDFFGFAPWDAEAYTMENAPFPIQWNQYQFTREEQAILQSGETLMIVCTSSRTGAFYSVNVSFGLIREPGYVSRWGIIPHFDEFNQPACDFTRETCRFMPIFDGKKLSLAEIQTVRSGGFIVVEGISQYGNAYQCRLSLQLDQKRDRWRLMPDFI